MPINWDDSTTLRVGPFDLDDEGDRAKASVPALTILWHTDLARVGETALLPDLLNGTPLILTRDEPLFAQAGSMRALALNHRTISREPVFTVSRYGAYLVLEPGAGADHLEVREKPVTAPVPLRPEDLQAGVVITNGFSVFCLHTMTVPVTRSPTLGLLGVGDGIEAVRRQITTIAPLAATVLVRGESGTGKELVARALHDNGPRRGQPFVAVNMATVLPARADYDLFGYEKGAYTGATAGAPGYFRAADHGTLLLDEIGKLHLDVQPMLLRVLQDFQVQPVGSPRPRPVDVRVIAATDAKLEELNATGAFDDALYNRLTGGMVISLPPLRERREDIGLLFLHCLRKALGRGGAYRLADVEGREEWLPARAVAAICCHALPGNFRNLEGLAAKVSVEAKAFPPVIKKLREFAAPSDTRDLVRGKLSTMTLAQIVDVLHQAAWNMSQAARTLGVEPSSLSRRLRKDPHIHAFAKLSVADLERRLAAAHGDVAALARQLGVSTELLSRRLSR